MLPFSIKYHAISENISPPVKQCSIKKKFLIIPFSLNNKLQVKSEVERETYKLKVTKEASTKCNGPTSYGV